MPVRSGSPGQAGQGIAGGASAGGVPEAGHVHGVTAKALAVDAHVGQHVPVEAVIVPHLLDPRVLKEGFECLQQSLRLLLLRVT